MRAHETAARRLEEMDIGELLDLAAWSRAYEEMRGAGPGEEWLLHRHCALQHAHRCRRGDGHVHVGFDAQLGPALELTERS